MNEAVREQFIVGVRFFRVGKVYHFDATAFPHLQPGDFVLVDTSRGQQLGEVVQIVDDPVPPPEGTWKPILRPANARDLALRQIWKDRELEALIHCRAIAADRGITGAKFVAAEFSFDGSRLAILYSPVDDARVNLKPLATALKRHYPQATVEMRRIGPRDVAKILGGMGACGMENRCCSRFLTEFSPISIKMAKAQGISLDPTGITGMCGRLRCCLIYEYEQYVEARKHLPKLKKRVVTPLGEGKVVSLFPLKGTVVVDIPEKGRHEFSKEEIEPWDELEALRRKAEQPCARHGNGACDCQKR